MARRRINHDLHSPTIYPVAAFSDTEDLPVTLRGIDILTSGTLKVTDIEGNTATYTFYNLHDGATPAPTTVYPYRLNLQIKRIWSNGTSLSTSQIVPLH